jgi:hypothetical protein
MGKRNTQTENIQKREDIMISIEQIKACEVYSELQAVGKELNIAHEAGIKIVGVSKVALRESIVSWIENNLVNVLETIEDSEPDSDELQSEENELETEPETEPAIEETIETESEENENEVETEPSPDEQASDKGKILVTSDLKYEIEYWGESIKFFDYQKNEVYKIPADLFKSLNARTKEVYLVDFIEHNTPVHIPDIEEWLFSKGIGYGWTDTGLVNMDCRLFTDSDKYYAVNKAGEIVSTMDSAFFNPKWFKSQAWESWLGIEKKARKSSGGGAPGSRANNPNAKTPKVPQKLVDFMREKPRTVSEMMELMGWNYHNARNYLSYIKWNGMTLVSEGKGETRTHHIVG